MSKCGDIRKSTMSSGSQRVNLLVYQLINSYEDISYRLYGVG